ncbi:MAG: DUF4286 family protein [Rhodanobacteraceae bacterium]
MILYAVDLDLDAALAPEYLPWLRGHVRAMLALPGFAGAQILEQLEPSPAGRILYSVHYCLPDLAAYEAYLRDYAPRMRAADARFADRVHASRSVLRELE